MGIGLSQYPENEDSSLNVALLRDHDFRFDILREMEMGIGCSQLTPLHRSNDIDMIFIPIIHT